jgi:hypothetical protein
MNKKKIEEINEKDFVRMAEGGFNPQEFGTLTVILAKINELVVAINKLNSVR